MLRNYTPCEGLNKTPHELWTGLKPNLKKIRVIGCKAFCQIEKKTRKGKFFPVAYIGVLLGYVVNDPSYRVWCPESNKVYNHGAPSFDETAGPARWKDRSDKDYGKGLHFPHDDDVQLPVQNQIATIPELQQIFQPDNANPVDEVHAPNANDEQEENQASLPPLQEEAAENPPSPNLQQEAAPEEETAQPSPPPIVTEEAAEEDLPTATSLPSSPTTSSHASLQGATEDANEGVDNFPGADDAMDPDASDDDENQSDQELSSSEDDPSSPPTLRRCDRPGVRTVALH